MEKQLTPKQKARQKYEIVHKEERDKATKQFNTRLPVKEYDEITAFLKKKRMNKITGNNPKKMLGMNVPLIPGRLFLLINL